LLRRKRYRWPLYAPLVHFPLSLKCLPGLGDPRAESARGLLVARADRAHVAAIPVFYLTMYARAGMLVIGLMIKRVADVRYVGVLGKRRRATEDNG
jgi:hypothetical protein